MKWTISDIRISFDDEDGAGVEKALAIHMVSESGTRTIILTQVDLIRILRPHLEEGRDKIA